MIDTATVAGFLATCDAADLEEQADRLGYDRTALLGLPLPDIRTRLLGWAQLVYAMPDELPRC